jgi:hypothetical protein
MNGDKPTCNTKQPMNTPNKTPTMPKQKRQKPRRHQRLMPPYILVSGVERHRISPHRFWIPPQSERESLRPGDHFKLMFCFPDTLMGERMWVIVKEVRPEYYVGVLNNYPALIKGIRFGQKVQFHSDHVINIDRKGTN